MKIYYNKNQFPNTLEECYVNDDIVGLINDIEYIPSDHNEIVIESDDDEEDWDTIYCNWDCFIEYFIATLTEEHMNDDRYKDVVQCTEIIDYEFIISDKRGA